MYLRKPVLEHMRMENVSFGHHLGHLLGMNDINNNFYNNFE